MTNLFSQRLKKHLSEMARYLRYVFNDHFVIALMFMVGGLGLGYSNGLKQLSVDVWWAPYTVVAVLTVILQLGRLATLMEDADVVFLLPREHSMHAYLTKSKTYSAVMAGLIQLLGWFILIPFVRVTNPISWPMLIGLLVIQLVLKYGLMEREVVLRYQYQHRLIRNGLIFKVILPVAIIALAYLVNVWLGLLLAIIFTVGMHAISYKRWQGVQIDWKRAIQLENNRMLGIYRFFNLFTNVPSITGSVKRRRYLDFVLARIQPTCANTYRYLFSRGILRGSEFSNLYLRLTLLGMALLIFIDQQWLVLALAVLFIYLIGFQLIPFYFHFDDNVFTHLYPVTEKQKIAGFNRTTTIALVATAILFSLTVLIARLDWQTAALSLVIELVEIFLLVRFYMPTRLRKK
ncbi:ABC transporter permease [Secundilactobacillus oryzae JCM 18671]|uniref:ABC transporter permease n=2 Tax=Secundilactobacillus oryzae TaxID=1202668 RepID=A0A081BG42_9LACO|nr:ABC transporter permease [Secundilactobacillus oryzae]GAK47010.1 ABC transporter permease [Secundilactobacillus oryzae JCM 18671]